MDLEKELLADGWKWNIYRDALDKGNTRVYWDDIDICIVRSNSNGTIRWENRIDGNMPVAAQKKLIDMMEGIK